MNQCVCQYCRPSSGSAEPDRLYPVWPAPKVQFSIGA